MIKNYIFIVLIAFIVGCFTGLPEKLEYPYINPADRNVWMPADKEDLEHRRFIQKRFNHIEKEIENLFMNFEVIVSMETNLHDGAIKVAPKIDSLESDMIGMIASEKNRKDDLGKELSQLKKVNIDLNSKVNKLSGIIKPDPVFSTIKYRNALNYFRNGKYLLSAKIFEKSLISNPPYSVKDNLLFGLGMSHYKLGNISLVSKPLSRLIKEYPDSEKWFMSHVILALTNYRQREKSKALYILEQGLKRNPPHFILSVMQNLMDLIQEKTIDAGS
jgi:TolA-binding protein